MGNKFMDALNKITTKGKDLAVNYYLSENPTKYMFADEKHISYINQKLPSNIWIEKDRTIGESVYTGYYVVERVKHSKPTDSKAFQEFNDQKIDRYFTESSHRLEEYLKKHYAKELGFDKMDVSGLSQERVDRIMAGTDKPMKQEITPEMVRAAQAKTPTMQKTLERAI